MDSAVNKTEYRSKGNPTGKPRLAGQQPKHQAPISNKFTTTEQPP